MKGLADRPRSGRPPVFAATVVAQIKALACSLPAPGPPEGERNAVRAIPVGGVRYLDVHVRFGAVTRIPAIGEWFASLHPLSWMNLHRA
ncbi:MAG: helix-turn-helix domain-containing protein, partial [Marmoricola sp.]